MRIFDLIKSKVEMETKIGSLEVQLEEAVADKIYYRDMAELINKDNKKMCQLCRRKINHEQNEERYPSNLGGSGGT